MRRLVHCVEDHAGAVIQYRDKLYAHQRTIYLHLRARITPATE